ncbi:FAD-dependent oxidoreductase [Haloprofundus salinisoli]|uniref:FAD-dependent oxidoreductase n=1 Tax=Haloprofundus salinisoli TaxID=2876193 RepID=UPI001CCE1E2C|nr:FAD-dependent oxidoreductase [Haloprofundus salinisoli]
MKDNDHNDTDATASRTDQFPAGERTSVWLGTSPTTEYAPLDGGIDVDTAVVGGGIVGVTTALQLAEAGQDVALVERDHILTGVTGKTTAKLTSQHGIVYDTLASTVGEQKTRQYAEANEAAIDHVESRVESLGIDCAFRRLPSYAYVRSSERRSEVRQEVNATRRFGLPSEYEESIAVDDEAVAAVRFDDQAMFHPRNYLLALAEAFLGEGGRIYEETRALDVEGGARPVVDTDRGEILADDVVLATHFPIHDTGAYFARMHPKRSYVVAARVADPPTEAMYYYTGDQYFSVRTHDTGDEVLTLVGGQNHKTGQGGDTSERYRKVEEAARRHFDVESVEYRWSTQDYASVDKVPYVGAVPFSEHVYMASGFGGWGMTNGTASGLLLADLVRGEENSWADVYDPSRVTVDRTSATEFATQNANVAKEFVRDWLSQPHRDDLARLRPGESTVLRERTKPIAAYRDDDGELHTHSAVCPHMDCIVHWNDAERSWDCPCHGSRFEYDGHVVDGPAVSDLPTRNLDVN